MVVVQGRNNVYESTVRAAKEPMWMFEKTLPATQTERQTDFEKQERMNF